MSCEHCYYQQNYSSCSNDTYDNKHGSTNYRLGRSSSSSSLTISTVTITPIATPVACKHKERKLNHNHNDTTTRYGRRKTRPQSSSLSLSCSLLGIVIACFKFVLVVEQKTEAFQSQPPALKPLRPFRTAATTSASTRPISTFTTTQICNSIPNSDDEFLSKLAEDESAVHLRVVHFNDVYKLDHLPKLKGFLESLKTNEFQDDNNVICTLGGDFFSPSLLSSIDKGKAMVSCLGSFVDYACLGNHEADHGTTAFQTNVRDFDGTIINSNFPVMPPPLDLENTDEDDAMPSQVTLALRSRDETHQRRVTLLGLLESSPNLYLPNAFCPGAVENAIPIQDCVRHYRDIQSEPSSQQQQSTPNGEGKATTPSIIDAEAAANADLILPLTHQDFELDEELARAHGCPKHMPIVLGGHDHDPYDIVVPLTDESTETTKCRVLKAGIDAEKAIVVDFVWESASQDCAPRIRVEFVDIQALPDTYVDDALAHQIDEYRAPLRRLDRTVLKVLERRDLALSSEHIRRQQTTIGSLICSALRKALGADVSVMNAGCIRGNSKYTSCLEDDENEVCRATEPNNQKFFTFADLLNELPYSTDTCVVKLPGRVLEAMIDYSRNQHAGDLEAGGGFLQCCNKMDVVQEPSGKYKILQIRGEPFDPHRMYSVATLYHLLKGMDDLKPLMEYVHEYMEPANLVPHIDAARPAKELVLQVYYREIWLILGGFDDIDVDGTGEITREKLGAALASKFGNVGGGDGSEGEESISYVDDDFIGDALLAFDSNKDGKVTRAEYEACMLAIRRHRFDLTPTDCVGIVQVMDVVKYLNKRILQEGNPDDKALLRDVVEREVFEAGETILRQGDEGDCLYFCEQGTVNFIADGKEVGSCGMGGSFGELSLLYDSPRAACCIASTKCKLWKVDRPAFQFLLVQAANRHNEDVMSVIQYITTALADPKERIALEEILTPKQKAAGEVIIQQGDLGDCLYFCEKGKIQFVANGEEVGCATAGGSFGELALLYDTPRAATCLALTDCRLWTVNRPAFHRLLQLASNQQKVQEDGPHRELFVSDTSLASSTTIPTTTKNFNTTALPVIPTK